MKELSAGLWWWESRHPGWTAEDDDADHGWGPEVSSYAFDDGTSLLLVDPTVPPARILDLAKGRETSILLTCPWHWRSTTELVASLGATLFSPSLEGHEEDGVAATTYAPGDTLPAGVQAFPGAEPIDLVLWIPGCRAVAAGDTFVDRGAGLELPTDWISRHADPDDVARSLRQLLDQPVELVLPTHGSPAERAAFERALDALL